MTCEKHLVILKVTCNGKNIPGGLQICRLVSHLYHKVTTKWVYGFNGLPYWRANPKSQIFNSPRLFRSKLDVFKSLWRTQLSCRYLTPSSNWSIRHLTSLWLNGCFFVSINALRSCSIYSITMKMLSRLLPTTTSFTSTIEGWSIWERYWMMSCLYFLGSLRTRELR